MLQPLVSGFLRKAARHSRSKPFAMRNAGPLVSFTFDDVPASAYSSGAAILEQHGLRGTFYIAAGTLGATDKDWQVIEGDQVRALHEQGHEIGCHTFSHVGVDGLDARMMDEECRRNREALCELCAGVEPTNFCYPFGRVSLPRKLQLADRFDSCRGIYEGINSGIVDLALLRVIELYDRTLTRDKLERVSARDSRAQWLADFLYPRRCRAAELDRLHRRVCCARQSRPCRPRTCRVCRSAMRSWRSAIAARRKRRRRVSARAASAWP